MADTSKPMQGTWTLAAPDGRTWSGESPSRCVAAESRERVPAEVALQRIFDAASEDHDWKPIETAPKDGTRVILSWSGKSISGFYLDNSRTATPWAGWRVESMVAQPAGTPTHWQAFPPPYGLTGAQPAPAAPSEPMPSIPNDPECTCGSTSPRAYHHAGSCPHSTPWNDRVKARLAAAPAAQPADSAMVEGFDGSTVRVGPNHSTIEVWFDTEQQARAAHRAICNLIEQPAAPARKGETE